MLERNLMRFIEESPLVLFHVAGCEPLPDFPTAFQTEVHAIERCAQFNLYSEGTKVARVPAARIAKQL